MALGGRVGVTHLCSEMPQKPICQVTVTPGSEKAQQEPRVKGKSEELSF